MKRQLLYPFIIAGLVLLMFSCSRNNRKDDNSSDSTQVSRSASTADKNDILTGAMSVIVDEAEFPIMKEQLEVFKSSYTNSNIRLISLPEREAINSLLKGDAGMAILARVLSEEESAGFKNRNISPKAFPVWYDGVVFVNNTSSADTSINQERLRSLLIGESSGTTLLLDNVNSSMVRRVKDFAKVDQISSKSVSAMKNSMDLLKEIEGNSQAIGILSYAQYLDYRRQFGEENKIRILSLQNKDASGKMTFTKPSQTTFATEEYALTTMFYVVNYQPNMGLGIGFSAFLTGDRGQRVVLKSGLLPVNMPGRELIIRDNIN